MVLKELPVPEWYGFETGCFDKFLAFAVNQRTTHVASLRTELTKKLNKVNKDIKEADAKIRKNTALVPQYLELLKESEEALQVDAHKEPARLEVVLKKILSIPYVTHLRVDNDGWLVVRIALRAKGWFAKVDLGDVEISFRDPTSTKTYSLELVRDAHDGGGIRMTREYYEPWVRKSKAEISMTETPGDLPQVIRQYWAHLQSANKRIAWRFSYTLKKLPELIEVQDRDLVLAAIAKTKALSPGRLRLRHMNIVNNLANTRTIIDKNRTTLRSKNTELRSIRARLAQLNVSAQDAIELTPRYVAEELRKIITLPGVMGLRFTKKGVPVFHVRTSLLLDKHRYDMGDYEVVLQLREKRGGGRDDHLVNVRTTRGGSAYYYHKEHERSAAWFCFGNRAAELRTMYRRGQYAAFMGLMINSLNSVNGDRLNHTHLAKYYDKIPADLVWKTEMPSRSA